MQRKYWSDLAKFFDRWRLTPLACILLEDAQPLMPIASQLILVGLPLFQGLSLSKPVAELADILGDKEQTVRFFGYLRGGE